MCIYIIMSERGQIVGKRKAILMWPTEAERFIQRERTRSLNRREREEMSQKEKREALSALLELVKNHEGEWSQGRLAAELGVSRGLRRDTVIQYVSELIAAERIVRRGENLYLSDQQADEGKEKK